MATLIHQCRLFFIALQFFTRIPIPAWVGYQPDWLHQSARYFPLVGLLVGAVAAAVYAVAAWLWPAPVAALLSTAAAIYLTGCFHEDGFADMVDGFGGGVSRERVLEIMKDSRIGSYGAAALALLLGLKVSVLSLLAPSMAVAALLLAHPLSRLAASALIFTLDYARENGKAKPMAQRMHRFEFALACLCVAIPAFLLGASNALPWAAVAASVLAAGMAAAWLGVKCVRRIGGYTGDCLGAVQQLAEVAVYLCVLAGARQGAWQ